MNRHPFVTWFYANYGRSQDALGDLARDLQSTPEFPRSGGRAALSGYLNDVGVESWALSAFDQAWDAWCTAEFIGSPSDGGRVPDA